MSTGSADVRAPGPARPEAAAVIHDIRYSRYTGSFQGRQAAIWALTRSSAQRALGIRRSAGSKVWPFLLIAAAFIPALVAVGVPVLVGPGAGSSGPLDLMSYAALLNYISLIGFAFVATTLPSLLTRERRDRVLSLYFSTAVSPAEYLVGKLLAAILLVLLITLGPMLLLLLGGIVTSDTPIAYAQDHAGDWHRIFIAALLISVYHSAIALGLGALTERRVFAVGGYLALMLVPAVLSGVLFAVTRGEEAVLVVNLALVPVALANRVLQEAANTPDIPSVLLAAVYLGVVLLGVTALITRYLRGRQS